jgi:thiamine phosphate synthase YjbQ (UPF0047 family)
METTQIHIDSSKERIVDLTQELQRFCAGQGSGLVNVFVPHATAGVALMEMGSGSELDLREASSDSYRAISGTAMSMVPRGHGADHILPVLVSPSVTLPVLRVGSRSARGSHLHSWTSISTIPGAKCDSASCPPHLVKPGLTEHRVVALSM